VVSNNAWLKSWVYKLPILILIISLQTAAVSHASFLSNSIDRKPVLSKNLSFFLIDLSGSIDYEVLVRGVQNLRQNLAYVYDAADLKKKKPAATYYRWIPIRGAEANSADIPIFTEVDDVALWTAAYKIKGKTNQEYVLRKLREPNGLWGRLMIVSKLDMTLCTRTAYNYLRNPGLSGASFQRLNQDICTTALTVRARINQIIANVEAFTKPVINISKDGGTSYKTSKATTGTDIFGTINKLENTARNSQILNSFRQIRLIFVSDMLHNTDNINLRKYLAGKSTSEACNATKEFSQQQNGFQGTKYRVTIYGLGEVKEKKNKSTANREKLYPVLREFWDCYWKGKNLDIPDSDFQQLNAFTRNE
jgi:hypothetical protein